MKTDQNIYVACIGPDKMAPSLSNPAEFAPVVFDRFEQYDLPAQDLTRFAALSISIHADQRFLLSHKDRLEAYLDQGGIVLWNGPMAYEVIDGVGAFLPRPQRNLTGLKITRLAEHPLFAGVSGEDLTFRRGVAGFWGRGHNAAPEGAVLLNGMDEEPEQAPIDWIWQRPKGGIVISHAGNDFLTFALAGIGTGADLLASNFAVWLTDQVHTMSEKRA
ncbi:MULTISPECIES: hypothetical protein [Thalassospira]|uniref:Glutamine amidotransferase domain-containing protein n=1 Tax=Thalassospira aquimaris TaxID=3037796 RepID=A0ABT6G9U8_9PROT|nr:MULTISPECIES: hypothetical protein [Thalassospira]MDG4718794.1 hypothetical protein [Thalassospira sp. FZY0004]